MTEMHFPEELTLRLHIGGQTHYRLICTNDDLEPLICGFLYNEGVICEMGEICSLEIAPDGSAATVQLRQPEKLAQPFRGTGLGGLLLQDGVPACFFPVRKKYTMEYIRQCAGEINRRTVRYQQTGGMHCSGQFVGENLLALFEDIGRHNTLDKLTGHCLLQGTDAADSLLITTGRISLDMVRKASRMGASVIASFTTPTLQAVEAARGVNITLVRNIGRKAEVCTGSQRIGD